MMQRETAIQILRNCHITGKEDFHALGSATVEKLLSEAGSHRYRKPRNANGSTARMFHAYVVRRAFPATAIEYRLHVNYGQGYEHELSEDTAKEIKDRAKEYRENCPQYPVKVTRAVVKQERV